MLPEVVANHMNNIREVGRLVFVIAKVQNHIIYVNIFTRGVCGWGNGDMQEEQTLHESGKLAHSEERAPCVRKERSLSLASLG